MKETMNRKHTGIILLALALALSLAVGTAAFAAGGSSAIPQEEIDAIVNTETDASQITSPFISVAEKVRGSVVGVNNYQTVRYSNYNYYGFGFPFGNDYDRGNNEGTEQLYGTGSGVVVSKYGHVLTNYHVVEDATRVTVTIADSDQEYEASVVVTDKTQDIAVLLVDGLPVEPVALGDSDSLQVGEWAIVIGNPLSETFARTVTVGIVSALDRQITDTERDRYGRRTRITNSMIQVDAAINSGNSGGGMFNTLGQLMGIPARKYSSSGFSSASIDNIGMCIPVNVAKPLIREALEQYGSGPAVTARGNASASSDRPMLGITVSTLQSSGALPTGALVMLVNDDSNASRAGIQKGDIIVEINGTVVTSASAVVSAVQNSQEGDVLDIKLYRAPGMDSAVQQNGQIDLSQVGEGEYITLTVTLLGSSAA